MSIAVLFMPYVVFVGHNFRGCDFWTLYPRSWRDFFNFLSEARRTLFTLQEWSTFSVALVLYVLFFEHGSLESKNNGEVGN
jgi:hypothetical protein